MFGSELISLSSKLYISPLLISCLKLFKDSPVGFISIFLVKCFMDFFVLKHTKYGKWSEIALNKLPEEVSLYLSENVSKKLSINVALRLKNLVERVMQGEKA